MKTKTEDRPRPEHMMTKGQILKLKAGTWIKVWWRDADPCTMLLLEKPVNEPGELTLQAWHPDPKICSSYHIGSSQVIEVIGTVEVPD